MACISNFKVHVYRFLIQTLNISVSKYEYCSSVSSSKIYIKLLSQYLLEMIILYIFFILFIWQRYRNKDTDGNTYEEPFTTLQENAYETSANVYTNEEGGYEQLSVDQNTKSGYSVQSDDPYDSIDDRIRSGLSPKEEIILEEK